MYLNYIGQTIHVISHKMRHGWHYGLWAHNVPTDYEWLQIRLTTCFPSVSTPHTVRIAAGLSRALHQPRFAVPADGLYPIPQTRSCSPGQCTLLRISVTRCASLGPCAVSFLCMETSVSWCSCLAVPSGGCDQAARARCARHRTDGADAFHRAQPAATHGRCVSPFVPVGTLKCNRLCLTGC